MHGYQRGHKEMAGAYGLAKAYKPRIPKLPAAVKSGTGRDPRSKGNPCRVGKNPCKAYS